MGEHAPPAAPVDGTGARVALVAARFNESITSKLLDGARATLRDRGVRDRDVTVVWVPGAFELPIVAQRLAASGTVDAIVCLGAVIRGETPHFDYVAGQAAAGLMSAALATGVPIAFGVLTTDDVAQAEARAGGPAGHKGCEAALTALEMVALLSKLSRPRPETG